MARQDVTLELYYDSAWHDITANEGVRAEQPIVITRGVGDEGAALRPAQITAQVANTDDRYRTSNPVSPLYGKAGLNTPMRVSVGGAVRGVAEASSWRPGQTPDFRATPPRGKAWVDVAGGGLLQRINQWTEPLRSPLYRSVQLGGVTPAEYWPMEDAAGSTTAVSAAGGAAMTPVTTVRYTLPDGSPVPPGGAPQFGSGSGIPGSAKLPSFQGGGTLRAPIRTATFDGYAIDWVMQLQAGTDVGGTASVDVLSWRESGTYVHYTVNLTKGFVTVFHANAADDATLAATGSATAALDPFDGAAHHYRYQVSQEGGDYLAELYIDGSLYAIADNFTPGMAGTVGEPTSVEWNPLEDRGDYLPIAAGHLIVWPSGQLGDQPAVFEALTGHAGETTADRFDRLMTEVGSVNYAIVGTAADSHPMGPQRVDTLPGLLAEIVATEDGLLFDSVDDAEVTFLLRGARYNQAAALELTPTDLPAVPAEVVDDLGVHNVVTASQREGGDYTARDDTGPLGTQAPPDGVGEYRQTVNVNVHDERQQLPQMAYWWLHRGTVNLPRYPRIPINLTAASPELITAVEAVDVGSVITIAELREYVVRLFVLGYVETVGTHTRSIVFTCAPDRQFNVGAYDDGVARYDSASTTLKTSVAAAATSLTFRTTNVGDLWSTTDEPYDVIIAGQRSTVVSMGSASLVSGAYDQAATVIRGVDGIHKALDAGEEIHIATPGRYAL